jgi:hypothetical protein
MHRSWDAAGKMWLYASTGNPAAPYASRVQSDTGWSGYDVVFQASRPPAGRRASCRRPGVPYRLPEQRSTLTVSVSFMPFR